MRFSDPGRLLVVLLAVLCLTGGIAGVGVGTAEVTAADTVQTTPTNNTTIQQQDPDEVDESGDTEALRSYLAQRLSEQLGKSSINISQGQYEQGQSVLGEEYDSVLEQYVDVAGDEDSDVESFQEAQESQRQYAELLQQYNETYEQYQAARDAGNSTRSRELARELNRLSTRINQTGANVTRSYTRIENTTGVNFQNASQQVQNSTEEVSEQQQTVVSETFVETNLSARTEAKTVAFTSPALITGQLTLANGTALANETVAIQVGGRTYSVETDADGAFSLDYRPVVVAANASAVTVRFRPEDGSVYLGSRTTVSVGVEQSTADLTATVKNASASFSDRVVVNGRATVNGTPVPNASVRVSIGGVTLSTVNTSSDGRFTVTSVLPSTVAAGDGDVQVQVVPAGRAVRSTPASKRIRIERTATNLSITVTKTAEGLRTTGTLRTGNGTPLANETVELRVDGTTFATVETDGDGGFARSVSLDTGESTSVNVSAVFDRPQGNLEDARAERQLDLGAGTPDRGKSPVPVELVGGLVVIVLAIGTVGWLVWDGDATSELESEPEQPVASTGGDGVTEGTGMARELLDRAVSCASSGDADDAVLALYAATRRSLNGEPQQTHWEFYADASDGLDADTAGTLERLTEAYERALYSPGGVDADVAGELVNSVEQLLEGDASE